MFNAQCAIVVSLLLASGAAAAAQQADSKSAIAAPAASTRTSAQPGSEAALRRLFVEVAGGKPAYEQMSAELAVRLREELPKLQQELLALGEVKSVTFASVLPDGADIFDVRLANGALKCMIRLDPRGKTVAVADCRQATLPPL